ncbi:WHG domain-containing protein [Streptomyces sp. NPDC006923]|uniref:TetR/AcrR family transcriptional regulator n=1 Tax=Streptomyces sp. NPDC006923 TaxID=3155355 RepID=UPI00340F6F17
MPRAGLSPAAVVAAGAALADEVGFAELSMGLLAERVGVRTPSLYKHTASLDALRHGISVQAKREFGHALARAAVGRSGPDAVHAIADAYRRWAVDHPGRYAATIRAPAAGDEEDLRVSSEALEIFLDVLAGFGLRDDRAIDATRTLRSALHGFVSLESSGGFGMPRDVDRSFRYLVDTLIAGLRADQPSTPPAHEGPA